MRYVEYKENREHGTLDFPFAYYIVTPEHQRYNMVYHWHAEHEIIHIISGEMTLTLDGERYTARKGDVFFVTEGMLHGGMPASCSYECLLFNLHTISSGATICKTEMSFLLHQHRTLRTQHPIASSEMRELCKVMMSHMRAEQEGYQFSVLGALYGLLGLFKKKNIGRAEVYAPQTNRKLIVLKKVLTLIMNQYQEDLSLDDMASCANMNKKYFCRFFKEMTGQTPVKYLNYYRIESVCEELCVTDKTITEVALSSGFNDVNYFIKVFKKHKHMTPTDYLKEHNVAN